MNVPICRYTYISFTTDNKKHPPRQRRVFHSRLIVFVIINSGRINIRLGITPQKTYQPSFE